MTYGNLHLFVGPMFSGKTEELIKEVLWRTYFIAEESTQTPSVGVFQPALDNRFGEGKIVSHNGACVSAQVMRSAADLPDDGMDVAFFDEVQFFAAPSFEGDFADMIRALRRRGTTVYCSGLDMDYLGRAFEVTSTLMAEASHLERRKACCAVCQAPATHTSRHEMTTAERILLGAEDHYAPMCATHWFQTREAQLEASGLGGLV